MWFEFSGNGALSTPVACYVGFCWAIPTLFGLGSVQGKIYVCCSVDFNVYAIERAGFVTPLPHCVECGLSQQKGIATQDLSLFHSSVFINASTQNDDSFDLLCPSRRGINRLDSGNQDRWRAEMSRL